MERQQFGAGESDAAGGGAADNGTPNHQHCPRGEERRSVRVPRSREGFRWCPRVVNGAAARRWCAIPPVIQRDNRVATPITVTMAMVCAQAQSRQFFAIPVSFRFPQSQGGTG
jgi:hypothetical protein